MKTEVPGSCFAIVGRAMITMFESREAISVPRVVFERTTHLYCTIDAPPFLPFTMRGCGRGPEGGSSRPGPFRLTRSPPARSGQGRLESRDIGRYPVDIGLERADHVARRDHAQHTPPLGHHHA